MITIGIDASRANVTKRTGTEWYIFNLLQQFKQLIPENFRVIIYTKEPLLADLHPLPANWQNCVLHWPPRLLWTQLRLSFAMLKWWSRPDILFIPAHTIPLIHPKKTIYVAHDLGFERYAELYANNYIGGAWMNRLIRLLSFGQYNTSELDYHRWSMRFAAHHAFKIITISKFTKQELQHFYSIPEEKITVVYNGFSAQDYPPVQPELTKTVAPYLLFIGRIEHKKNIVNLIKAFSIVHHEFHLPHTLKLIGMPGFGYEDILHEIKQQAVTETVELCGYIPQTQMHQVMKQAAVFVFPSNYEGFGIPILEAMSTGTIVACSDIPALREIGGEVPYYFDKDNPTIMAQTIVTAVRNTSVIQAERRTLGYQRVQQFSWQRCAQQTWQVIQESISPSTYGIHR